MKEWRICRIGDICKRVCSGGTPKSTEQSYYNGDIPWLNTKEINFNRISSTEKSITQSGLDNSSAKWIDKNSVIVAMYGATAAKVAINTIPLTTNQACCNLSIDENIADYRFVYFWLCANYTTLASLANGGAQQNLNAQQIKDFEIRLADLATQQKIADILWSIDNKIICNCAINDNLEQQAQALFDNLIGNTNLEYSLVADINHTIETGRRPKGGVANITSGVPSIGAENIKGLGRYDYSKTKYITEDFAGTMKKGIIKGYELLIYKDGGKPGYFIPNFSIFGEGYPYEDMTLNEHVFLLDFGNKGYNFFAYFFMQTEEVMKYLNAQGSKAAIPGINRNDVESIFVPTIDNKEVKEFCDIVEPIITTILVNSKESSRLASLRDTLLPKLMNGELGIDDISLD